MNLLQEFLGLGIKKTSLTKKKQQTTKKIEYVREYVNQWAIISAERTDVQSINFVDCMCNAGVYQDGDCCTAIEVLLVFSDLCLKYPKKDFCLFCNDIDSEKIFILKKIVDFLPQSKIRNLHVYIKNQDVNEYLDLLAKNIPIEGKCVFGYGRNIGSPITLKRELFLNKLNANLDLSCMDNSYIFVSQQKRSPAPFLTLSKIAYTKFHVGPYPLRVFIIPWYSCSP